MGRRLAARGSPRWQAGGTAGAPENRLAAAPGARRLGEPLGQFESGGLWDVLVGGGAGAAKQEV